MTIPGSADRHEVDGLSDVELIQLAGKKRSEAAFEELFHRHKGMIHAFLLRLTADAVVAEDLTLDTFIAAWSALPRYRGDASLATWLCSIAVNKAREHFRSNSRRRNRLCLASGSRPTPRIPAWNVEIRVDLERAIARLSLPARTAVLLRHVHGLSYGEIAEVMSVPVGTAKSHVSRGCNILREYLE